MTRNELAMVRKKFPISPTVERLSVDRQENDNRIAFADRKQIEQCLDNRLLQIRPTTDELNLNKLEKRYLEFLRGQQPIWMGVQCIALKIGHDCRLIMDFWALDKSGMRAIDTKGVHRGKTKPHIEDDALVKLKVAARLYPMFHFVIAYLDGDTWRHEPIKP